LADGSHV